VSIQTVDLASGSSYPPNGYLNTLGSEKHIQFDIDASGSSQISSVLSLLAAAPAARQQVSLSVDSGIVFAPSFDFFFDLNLSLTNVLVQVSEIFPDYYNVTIIADAASQILPGLPG